MKKKYYIGVGTTFHDPSISIVDEQGQVVFAEATERYLQFKRALGCPADPVIRVEELLKEYCDTNAEFHIATTWSKTHLTSLKVLNSIGLFKKQPKGFSKTVFRAIMQSMLPDSSQVWFFKKQLASNIQSGTSIERNLRVKYNNHDITWHRFNHHETHAALACYGSGMDEALCLVMDGTGEMGALSYFHYQNGKLKQLGHNKGFESMGYFYLTLTELCGFDPIRGEEWKVMGMAPYGKKDEMFYDQLGSIFTIKGLKIKFKTKPAKVLETIDEIARRIKDSGNDFQLRANLAYTGQFLFTEYMTELIGNFHKLGLSDNLVYTGGCALNSAYNGKIAAETGFKNVYIPSAPGDDGNSLGAAWLACYKDNPEAKTNSDKKLTPYLGSVIKDEEIEGFLKFSGFTSYRHLPGTVAQETAKLLAEGKLVGWVQGRSEFGPRALGNRSILADPRSKDMKDKINSRVKFREEFRPFAPSILEEYGEEYFEQYQDTPYMERTLDFRPEVRDKVPAVVHENRSGRLQSVKKDWNPRYHELIDAFREITGVPVLLNTSFNVMGKPIVHSFNDALMVFFNSGLDVLVVNDYLFEKTPIEQELTNKETYETAIS